MNSRDLGWKPRHWWNQWTDRRAYSLDERLALTEDPQRRLARMEKRLAKHLRLDGPDAYSTTNYKSHLAGTLERLGRVDDACILRREVFATCSRYLGDEDPRTLKEGIALIQVLTDCGAQEEASDLAARLGVA